MSGDLKFPLAFSMSVPDYGRLLCGLGRDASYDAAERGEIPTVKIGRSLRVSTYAGLQKLGWPDDLIARALGLAPDSTNDEPGTGSPSASIHVLATKTTGDPHHAPDAG